MRETLRGPACFLVSLCVRGEDLLFTSQTLALLFLAPAAKSPRSSQYFFLRLRLK